MILDDSSSSDDETVDGLLWEYPEPFQGNIGDDIYDFIEKVETAFGYNRVPASSRVLILEKLVKGYAESSFYDRESYEDNVERLKFVYGNPYTIWRKKLNDFLQESQEKQENWTPHFSPERELMLLKVSGFLATSECLASKFESLEGSVFSRDTFRSIMSVLPPTINQKIVEKEATMEMSSGTFNTYRQTFKNIQEVLKKEAKLEAIAERYYDALTESRERHNEERLEDQRSETSENSEQLPDKKTVHKKKEFSKSSALRNLDYHFQRISKNARLKKNVDISTSNFLTKSQQVMVQFKNVLSEQERSNIFNRMNKVKSVNAKMKSKVKNFAQRKRNPSQKFRPVKQKSMPQQNQKPKISELDENNEQDEDLMLPEVPTEICESVKLDVANLGTKANSRDEDIEKRLTKLQFFNKTWLKDVPKTRTSNTDIIHKVSSDVHEALAASDDEVPAADLMKEENAAEHLDAIKAMPEPIVSTKEEIDAFNAWYLMKISESKIPKKSKFRFLSPSCAITEEMTPITTMDRQVVTEATSPVWKVDMDVVIVLLVAIANLLPKYPTRKHFPVPVTASTSLTPSSFPVSGFETVFSAVSGTNADQSAESCSTEISLRDAACQTLPGVVWRKKFELEV